MIGITARARDKEREREREREREIERERERERAIEGLTSGRRGGEWICHQSATTADKGYKNDCYLNVTSLVLLL